MDAVNHLQLTVAHHQVKPILRALLLAIFFHRLLDSVEPDTYEIAETHVACAPSQAIEKEINSKIEDFAREYLERGAERGEIAVVFLQKKPRKGWLAIYEELIPWEEHLITLSFPRHSRGSPPANPLPEALLQLLGWCAEHTSNVPPLPSSDSSTLSHQILIAPPPPSELFAPSPPLPTRSPPPHPTTHTTPALALARAQDLPLPPYNLRDALETGGNAGGYGRRDSSPASLPVSQAIGGAAGYLESVKDGVRAVAGWGGRGAGKSGQ